LKEIDALRTGSPSMTKRPQTAWTMTMNWLAAFIRHTMGSPSV
jgi:hypothetical protein